MQQVTHKKHKKGSYIMDKLLVAVISSLLIAIGEVLASEEEKKNKK